MTLKDRDTVCFEIQASFRAHRENMNYIIAASRYLLATARLSCFIIAVWQRNVVTS